MIAPVLPRYFPMAENPDAWEGAQHVEWSLEFKKRNNDKVQRKAFTDYMKEMLDQKRTSSVYDDADVDLVVEVFRDMLVVAILPGFKRDFKKYNLQMLAGAEGADEDKERPTPVKLSDLIAMKKLKEQGLYVEEKKVE